MGPQDLPVIGFKNSMLITSKLDPFACFESVPCEGGTNGLSANWFLPVSVFVGVGRVMVEGS